MPWVESEDYQDYYGLQVRIQMIAFAEAQEAIALKVICDRKAARAQFRETSEARKSFQVWVIASLFKGVGSAHK